MNWLRPLLSFAAALASVAAAMAHDPGLSTGQLDVLPDRISAELIFAKADIEAALKQDGDLAEAGIAGSALSVRIDGRSLPADSPALRADELGNVHITATFHTREAGHLSVTSALMDRMPRGHRQFMTVHDRQGRVLTEVLLRAGQDSVAVDLGTRSATMTSGGFFRLGVEHILTGYDHLLFLFALLFVVSGFREAALIVTSFTVAHSITLAAATLNWVRVDARFVEPLIAASIVYVGVENLLRRHTPRGRRLLTFAFGLVHGLGFAGVLRDLGVGPGAAGVVVPLLSFNLGVEAGQIAIAALVLPLILALRSRPVFVRRWVPALSTAVIVLGAFWLVERTLL